MDELKQKLIKLYYKLGGTKKIEDYVDSIIDDNRDDFESLLSPNGSDTIALYKTSKFSNDYTFSDMLRDNILKHAPQNEEQINAQKYVIEELKEEILNMKDLIGTQAVLRKYQDYVISIPIPRLHYFFLTHIEGANKPAFLEKIAASDDGFINFKCALNIYGSNKKAHEEAVIRSKDAASAYMFLTNIKGANEEALLNVIKNKKEANNLYNFYQGHKKSIKSI